MLGSPIYIFEYRLNTSVRCDVVIRYDDDEYDETNEYQQRLILFTHIVDIQIIQPDEYDSRYQ
jgi:hypothetical protein